MCPLGSGCSQPDPRQYPAPMEFAFFERAGLTVSSRARTCPEVDTRAEKRNQGGSEAEHGREWRWRWVLCGQEVREACRRRGRRVPLLPFLAFLTSDLCVGHSLDCQGEARNSARDQEKGQISLKERRKRRKDPGKVYAQPRGGRPCAHHTPGCG